MMEVIAFVGFGGIGTLMALAAYFCPEEAKQRREDRQR